MGAVADQEFVAGTGLGEQRDEVGHRAAGDVEGGLLAGALGGRRFQFGDRGVFAEDVVADFGLEHGLAHGRGRFGHGVGTQIDQWKLGLVFAHWSDPCRSQMVRKPSPPRIAAMVTARSPSRSCRRMLVTWSGSAPRSTNRALDLLPDAGVLKRAHGAGPGEGHDPLRQRQPRTQRLEVAEAFLGGVDAVDELDDGHVRGVGAEIDEQARFEHVEADDQHRRAVDHAEDFLEVDAVLVGHWALIARRSRLLTLSVWTRWKSVQ